MGGASERKGLASESVVFGVTVIARGQPIVLTGVVVHAATGGRVPTHAIQAVVHIDGQSLKGLVEGFDGARGLSLVYGRAKEQHQEGRDGCDFHSSLALRLSWGEVVCVLVVLLDFVRHSKTNEESDCGRLLLFMRTVAKRIEGVSSRAR